MPDIDEPAREGPHQMARYDPDHLVGYLRDISVRAGESVSVKVSCDPSSLVQADLVRIVGDTAVAAAGSPSEVFEGRRQALRPGSYCEVPDFPVLSEPVVSFDVRPGLIQDGLIGLIGTLDVSDRSGWGIGIENGHLSAIIGSVRHCLEEPVTLARWHQVTLRWSAAAGTVELEQLVWGISGAEPNRQCRLVARTPPDSRPANGGVLLMGAFRDGDGLTGHFTGRIGAPSVHETATPDVVAAWDFSAEMATDRVIDRGPYRREGTLRQQPARGVPGRQWDGTAHSWAEKPEHYDAVHFHADDLVDAGWSTNAVLLVPEEWGTGTYGVRLRTESHEDVIPFVVRPAMPTPAVWFLASTATYTAYGNQRLDKGGFADASQTPPDLPAGNRWGAVHPEAGPSLYETHSDGSGSMYASRSKPVADWRLGCAPWGFSADAVLGIWLAQAAPDHGVVTDEDLDREGVAALEGCRVLVTGTHPEYASSRMFDALADWLAGGGRLVYLGGNGFYWRVAYGGHPGTIEVRRAEDGTRAWMAAPGEYHHSFTGELGGLWRRVGRPPNTLLGVGFAAQGFGSGAGYVTEPAARTDPRTSWIFTGTSGAEVFGTPTDGWDGAAGQEVDRVDADLGSPAHAVVVASAREFDSTMLRAKEEHFATGLAPRDGGTRADLVFFETPSGGAVFSVGSIAWSSRLAAGDDVATITANVLARFADPAPFAWPAGFGSHGVL